MRFLLRMAFWLTVVLVLLPSGGSTSKVSMSALDAVAAAKATVADMKSFCERQPDACAVGSQAAAAIGQRAQAGAKMLYERLSAQFWPGGRGATADAAPGKVPPSTGHAQQILSPADLTPAWRDPQPRKEARSNPPT
jgi:hypothetical protein